VLQGLPPDKQVRAILLQLCKELVKEGWDRRHHIGLLLAPWLEKKRTLAHNTFRETLSELHAFLHLLHDISLKPDLHTKTLSDSLRYQIKSFHHQGSQVITLLVGEDRDLITGTGLIDIVGTMQRAADIEMLIMGPSASPSDSSRRPGIKPSRNNGTVLATKGDQRIVVRSREEWAALSAEAKRALAAQERKAKTRESFKTDSNNKRIVQVYCVGPNDERRCGWVDGANIKDHNATCPHRRGGARDHKGGKTGGAAGVAAFGGKCHNCGQPGHFARDCSTKPAATATLLATLSSQIASLTSGLTSEGATVPRAVLAATAPSPSLSPTPVGTSAASGRRAIFASSSTASEIGRAHV